MTTTIQRLPQGWETQPPVAEPEQAARAAGLRYVSDVQPGIRRVREGDAFSYVDSKGHRITDPRVLERIRSLAVPPAWEDVWICPMANGHVQASGRDARGRKQYRYHKRWREVRDEAKYGRMLEFAKALPRIRARVDRDLALPGLPREKVLATVVRLLETTFIRVGNGEYARTNQSFGLTTLRDQHVHIEGGRLRFRFRGKSGKRLSVDLQDRRLARIVKQCRDIPGYELFQYKTDTGGYDTVDAADVNEYLRAVTGQDFTAKDFRTWAGTVLACMALQEMDACATQKEARSNVVRAVERVAERLGNTPAVSRKCYIHPEVIDAYLEGMMASVLLARTDEALSEDLRPEEEAVLRLLRARLEKGGSSAHRPPVGLEARPKSQSCGGETPPLNLEKPRL